MVAWYTRSVSATFDRELGQDRVRWSGVHLSLKVTLQRQQKRGRVSIMKVRPVPREWIARTYYPLPEEWNAKGNGVVAFTCWCPELGAHVNWVHSFPDVLERELRAIAESTGRRRFLALAEFLDRFDCVGLEDT